MMNELLSSLGNYQQAAAEARQKMMAASATVRSSNRVVSVTVNGSGQVSAIVFHDDKYRRMAPAELATLLLRTIQQARTDVLAQVKAVAGPMLLPGMSFDDVLAGKVDLTCLGVEEVLSTVTAAPPAGPADAPPAPTGSQRDGAARGG
jgi:DNA-binding protein YbaB